MTQNREQKFKGLIFDCDGTLADSMPMHWRAWQSVSARHGFKFSEERFYSLGGIPSRDILKVLSLEQGLVLDQFAVAKEKESEYLPLIEPDDLLKFGLIPEFVGRLPVVTTLHSLNHQALSNILTEPRNAIVKQYKKLFRMENVELEFEDEALKTVVAKALEKGTGARALRSIMEETMLEIMYHLPTRQNVTKCIITKDVILKKKEPLYVYKEPRRATG